ncbi:MAG: chromate transporter [Syntrophobacteraceae bacterium]
MNEGKNDAADPVTLWHIACTFLQIGLASFSLAALGEAQNWMTSKRKWFTDEEYMQGLGLAQILPGAPTVNLCSYLGFRLRGLPGAVAATVFFLIPSFLLMLLLTQLYIKYSQMVVVSGLFRGLAALVTGLVLNTIINLWSSGVKSVFNRLMAVVGFVMVFWLKMGVLRILLVAAGASLAMVLLTLRFPSLSPGAEKRSEQTEDKSLDGPGEEKGQQAGEAGKSAQGKWGENLAGKLRNLRRTQKPQRDKPSGADCVSARSRVVLYPSRWKFALLVFWLGAILAVDLAVIHLRPELLRMGWSFLRIGALTFGSGYAMLPFIQDTVVNQFRWLTNQQFAVALALSLITPGPVTIIGTFIGYKVAGFAGAVVGIVNMYFPSWAMTTLVTAPFAKAGRSVNVGLVVGGIVAAFIGTLAVVLIKLSMNTLGDIPSVAMACAAFILQRFGKVDTVWIVLAGALVSLAVFH